MMTTKYLFRSQINELIHIITGSDLNPVDFRFSKDLSKTSLHIALPVTIRFRDSRFFFAISHIRKYRVEYLPAERLKLDKTSIELDTWKSVLEVFAFWLKRVGEEATQPDPWNLLNPAKVLTDELPTDDRGSEYFTPDELDRLHQHIDKIRDFLVAEVQPTAEQLTFINEKLSLLEESAKRQNKKDWAYTATGIMFTIAVGLAMAPEQANKLFTLMSEFVKFIFIKLLT